MNDIPSKVVELVEKATKPKVEVADARPPAFSDEALAQQFVARHAETLRYVAAWSQWFAFTGTAWELDATLDAFDRARAICRAAASEADKGPVKTALASAKTVAAIERLAKSDRRIAARVDQWDANLDIINSTGTVNLLTGESYAPRATDYCTKLAGTYYDVDAECPTWHAFLARVTDNDGELQNYLQRMVGYCLTGRTSEHVMFFLYGTGANGKSVFVATLQGIIGEYAVTAPMEAFVEARGERHPTELAMLRGARLVVATETEEGRRWNESRVKAITGGDIIAARFMRADFFQFKPQFKVLIMGNHRPALRNVDEAIRRRIHLIPFAVTIPTAERDPTLAEKLKSEWPGIFAWAVRGTAEWRQHGLAPPAAVRNATDEYLAAEDAFALWLDECAEAAADWQFERTADLFASWKSWADRAGEFVGSQKRFVQNLHGRGFAQRREGGTGRQGFEAIRLRRPDYSDDPRGGR